MHILSIITLGIAANLDNLGIGLSYGVRRVKIPFWSNLTIALLSGIATVLSSFGGNLLAKILPGKLSNILGGAIVITVGIWVMVSSRGEQNKKTELSYPNQRFTLENIKIIVQEPHKADVDFSGHISIKEAFLLGVALAVNCLATGFGAGLTGLSVTGLTLSVMLFSLATIFLGVYVGARFASDLLGDKATLAAGILLVLIGLYEIFV